MSDPPVYTAQPPRSRPPPALVTAVGVGALLATLYPPAAERALAVYGVRGVAVVLLAMGLASLIAWQFFGTARVPIFLRAALLVLPGAAAVTGDALFLRLVPAAIQALIAALFVVSLRGGGSLFYDAARSLHPYAPDFIAPYCRKSTIVFAGIFALLAVVAGGLAFHPPASGWGSASGLWIWTPVIAASLVDWAVRKWWFRYFGPGPLDQLLKRLLPPENTAAGRRSLEYIRRMRAQLGMPPP
ncbi:MAG TPA: hypothetical protein VKH41_10905 [Myxococcota bacterium]|nr:hypothetical protein [Myxococcota bacterium]